MKFLTAILATLLTVTVFAQTPPPVSLKGQESATKLLPKWNIQVPNNQATNLGGIDALIETGNNNLLVNPSFEHTIATTGWTTGGTASAASSTSTVVHGKKSLCFTASSQTLTLTQDSTSYQAQFADGLQGILALRLKTNHTGAITICSRQAGTTSSTNCVTATADNRWGLYRVPFVLGATSNGLSISGASGTGTTCIDDTKVEAAADFDVSPLIQIGKTYTPTFTGITASNIKFVYIQVANHLFIKGSFEAGSPTASAWSFSLPNNATVDTTALSNFASSQRYLVQGTLHTSSSAGAQGVYGATGGYLLHASSATTTAIFGAINNASDASGEVFTGDQAGNALFNSGANVTLTAWVPIIGATASVNTYTDQCQSDVACTDYFVAKVGNTGTISQENVDWINGNASVSNTSDFTITFNSSVFSAAPLCFTTDSDNSTLAKVAWEQTDATTSSIMVRTTTAASAQDAIVWNLVCFRASTDFKARRQIVGSFKDIPQTIGTSGVDIQAISFGGNAAGTTKCTASSTCVTSRQIGTKITTVNSTALPAYEINGLDSNKYTCTGVAYEDNTALSEATPALVQDLSTNNTGKVTMFAYRGGNPRAISYARVVCIGVP